MTVLWVALAMLGGCLTGGLTVMRLMPRLIARLPETERLAFARKVNDIADRP